jgi:hypothetical protein
MGIGPAKAMKNPPPLGPLWAIKPGPPLEIKMFAAEHAYEEGLWLCRAIDELDAYRKWMELGKSK